LVRRQSGFTKKEHRKEEGPARNLRLVQKGEPNFGREDQIKAPKKGSWAAKKDKGGGGEGLPWLSCADANLFQDEARSY